MKAGRHLVRVIISFDFLLEMMTTGWTSRPGWIECIEGLPEDAELFSSYFENGSQQSILVFSHPSFDLVSLGEDIPTFSPVFRRHIDE